MLCFSIPLFHLPPLLCLFSSVPRACLVSSLPLCGLFLSNHSFTYSLLSLSLLPLCLSVSLIPLPIWVFFSPASASFSAFVPLFHCLFLPQLECDNFITVIQKVNDTMIICGTNAGSPRCWMLVSLSSDTFLEMPFYSIFLCSHFKRATFYWLLLKPLLLKSE